MPAAAPSETPTYPIERWKAAATVLRDLSWPDRLALLEVLAARGPLPLGVALFEAGAGVIWATQHARALRKHGLIAIDTSTGGLNLSAVCAITPPGLRALEAMAMWGDGG